MGAVTGSPSSVVGRSFSPLRDVSRGADLQPAMPRRFPSSSRGQSPEDRTGSPLDVLRLDHRVEWMVGRGLVLTL